MTPQINETTLSKNIEEYRQPDTTYRLGENTVQGKITGIESVKQSIYHIIMTERYSNPIYDDDYGIELEKYTGKDISFIEADIETTLREALLQDDRITDVRVESVTSDNEKAIIKFTVDTIYGSTQEEINVIQ